MAMMRRPENKANSKPISRPSAGNLCLRYPKFEFRNELKEYI